MTWLLGTAPRDRRDLAVGLLMLVAFATLPLINVRVAKTVAVSDVPLAAAAAVALLGGPLGRDPRRLLRRPLVVGLALLAAGGCVALAFAAQPLSSGVLLGRVLAAAAVSLVVLLWWDPPTPVVRRLLVAFLVGACLSAALGVLGAVWTTTTATGGFRDVIDRATGLTGNANHLGAVSAIAFGIALALAATSRRLPAALALGAAAINVAGVLWSGSRSGLVGLVGGAALVVVSLAAQRRWRPLVVTGGAGLAVFLLALSGLVRVPALDRLLLRTDTRPSTYAVESTDVRLDLARDRLADPGPHSLLVGSGMLNRFSTGGHSGYLEIWVGTGLVGFAGWLTVCATTLAPVGRLARRRGPPSPRQAALLAVGCGFVAHLSSTLFLEHIWDRYIWLLIALVAVLREDEPAAAAAPEPSPSVASQDPEHRPQ